MMISLAIDVVIAVLLVATIGFCIVLCARLKRLRADEEMMRQVVTDIVQSTGKAEHAIRTLKATADECKHTLGLHLKDARISVDDLKANTESAETVVRRLAEVVALARSAKLFERSAHSMVPQAANAPGPVSQPVEASPVTEVPQVPASALQTLRARAA